MSEVILVLNAGSSSLKFRIFYNSETLSLLAKGQVDGIGSKPHLKVSDHDGRVLVDEDCAEVNDHATALGYLRLWLRQHYQGHDLRAVGHRVVHGGPDYEGAVVVTPDVLKHLRALVPLAPLHQPHNLAAIDAVAGVLPEVTQVACFDTAFHRGHSKVASMFALPRDYYERGIRRYGFHGLSYEYISQRLVTVAPELATGRIVVAHLGSGASLCAIKDGKSVDTTMGFSALDGLPMGTRCGALDPGAVLYMMQQEGLSSEAIEKLLYKDAGLLGISGISNDLRVLLESDERSAREAIDYFIYRIVRETGALAAAMGGLDGLVFTAGIGENSPFTRGQVCAGLSWLGMTIDPAANDGAQETCISSRDSRIKVWVIPTNEERIIAQHTRAMALTT